MRSGGPNSAISAQRDFPALLDVTRLTSRVGRGPHTGVDRVEAAYLEWCLATEPALWGLAKVAGGYVVLDRSGLAAFHDRIIGAVPWGSRDLRAVVGIKTAAPRGAAESDLRRLSIANTNLDGLSKHFEFFAKSGCVGLNVGHSNLSEAAMSAMRQAGMTIAVFIHDVIPLEFPEFQAEGSVARFAKKIKAVAQNAQIILTNSHDSAQKITDRLEGNLGNARVNVAHLGVTRPSANFANVGNDRPYFVTLGTIEPRKNHGFLLDIWDELDDELSVRDTPDLHIIGHRGWADKNVITKLNMLKSNPRVHEQNHLEDADLWPLIQGAHGLLFPSFAEGFGLPSLEAAALGVPVICGDLAIHQELLGDYPVYASLQDRYLWKKTIIEQAGTRLEDLRNACAKHAPHIPTWDEHFGRINAAVMGST